MKGDDNKMDAEINLDGYKKDKIYFNIKKIMFLTHWAR
jgi:hypothetical protein